MTIMMKTIMMIMIMMMVHQCDVDDDGDDDNYDGLPVWEKNTLEILETCSMVGFAQSINGKCLGNHVIIV